MIDFARHENLNLSQNSPIPGNASQTAYWLHEKGDRSFATNRFEQAKEYYRQSFDAYQAAGDWRGGGVALLRLGRVDEIMGDYFQARTAYEKSLELFQDRGDLAGIARSKAHLGNLGWAQGDYGQAEIFLQEALSLYHAAGDVTGEAWVHDLIGNLYLAMREDQKAQWSYQRAFTLVEGLGTNSENEAWNSYHLGALSLFRQQVDAAEERFQEALQRFTGLRDDLGQAATHIHLAEVEGERKNFPEAEKNLQKAVQLVVPTQCKPLLVDILAGIAQLLKSKGDERKAISVLLVALTHPTCRQQTKDRMVALAVSLEARLSQREVAEDFKWAKSVSLEEMAVLWSTFVSAKTSRDKSF